MRPFLPPLLTLCLLASGCTMATAWKSIPPPGGCDRCHTVAIATNWQVRYQAATIADERGQLPFQTPQYNTPIGQQRSALRPDSKKVEQQQCFACHHAPTSAHRGFSGSYHHHGR